MSTEKGRIDLFAYNDGHGRDIGGMGPRRRRCVGAHDGRANERLDSDAQGEIGRDWAVGPGIFLVKKVRLSRPVRRGLEKTNLDLRHDSVEDVSGDIRDARRADEGTTGRIEYG